MPIDLDTIAIRLADAITSAVVNYANTLPFPDAAKVQGILREDIKLALQPLQRLQYITRAITQAEMDVINAAKAWDEVWAYRADDAYQEEAEETLLEAIKVLKETQPS